MHPLFTVAVNSFNLQGGGVRKKDCLAGLLSPDAGSILLLQDAGTAAKDRSGHMRSKAGTGFTEGAGYRIGNARFQCVLTVPDPVSRYPDGTASILIQDSLLPGVQSWGYEAVSGVSHYTCWADLTSGIRIASLHTAADPVQAAAEVQSSLLFLDGTSEEWLLMGSFHCSLRDCLDERQVMAAAGSCRTVRYGGGRERGYYCDLLWDPQSADTGPAAEHGGAYLFCSRQRRFRLKSPSARTVTGPSGRPVSRLCLLQTLLTF